MRRLCENWRGVRHPHIDFTGIALSYQIWLCPKIRQGQPRVIWTNYDGLESQMLQTKFRGNPSTGSWEDFWSVFTIYGQGGHLGHVTSIMSSNFHFLVPESFHTKFGSQRHSGLWENLVLFFMYMTLAQGQEKTHNLQYSHTFINSIRCLLLPTFSHWLQ